MMTVGFTPQAAVADRPLGYFQVAAGGADAAITLAVACGGAVPLGTALVILKPAAQALRYRDDGVAPTAAVGYPIAVAQEAQITSSNIAGAQIIAAVAGAVVDILCYGR